MGFFKTLATILLGTRKEYAVKDLGIFTCKVYDKWQKEYYMWWSPVRLPSYSAETAIVIKGGALAPLPQQLSDLQALLNNWKSVVARLDGLLLNESRLAHKEEIYASWQNKFYPEAIEPVKEDTEGWEITFVREDADDYFSFLWKNNTVRDLTLH